MDGASEPVSDEARSGRELLLDFAAQRDRLPQGLREALRAAIQKGQLPAGTVLPASRNLATQLGVSRGVASDTYDELACEGYLQVRPRFAPVVAQMNATTPVIPRPEEARWQFDFTAATPDVGLFPRRAWTRAMRRAELAQAAAARGTNISPLTPLHLVPSRQRGLLAGFGRLPEYKIPAAVAVLASVLAETPARGIGRSSATLHLTTRTRPSGSTGRSPKMPTTLKVTHKAIGVEVRRGTYDVVVDGERAGSVELNGTFEVPLELGHHTLQIRNGRNSSRTASFDADEGQIIAFRCSGKNILPIFLLSFVVPSLAISLRRE